MYLGAEKSEDYSGTMTSVPLLPIVAGLSTECAERFGMEDMTSTCTTCKINTLETSWQAKTQGQLKPPLPSYFGRRT